MYTTGKTAQAKWIPSGFDEEEEKGGKSGRKFSAQLLSVDAGELKHNSSHNFNIVYNSQKCSITIESFFTYVYKLHSNKYKLPQHGIVVLETIILN